MDSPDSPAQHIAKLQADLRGANSRAAKLQAENLELETRLRESDEIRAAVASATTDISFDLAVALGRVEQLTKLADAAVEWKKAVLGPPSVQRVVAARTVLNRLIDAFEKSKASRS